MLKTVLLTTLILFSILTHAQNVEVSAQLYSHHGDNFLAITFDHHPHWHTYWKNPGDAGTPPEIKFFYQDRPYDLKQLEWPIPKEMKQAGNLLAYGYGTSNALFYFLTPDQVATFSEAPLRIEATWLACKDICVPESISMTGKMVGDKFVVDGHHSPPMPQSTIYEIFTSIPQTTAIPANLEIYLTVDPGKNDLLLHYTFHQIDKVNLPKKLGLLTPFPQLPFSFQRETLYYQNNELHGVIDIKWEGEFEEPPIALPQNGICAKPWILKFLIQNPISGEVHIIEKKISKFQTAGIATKKAYYQTLAPYNQPSTKALHTTTVSNSTNESSTTSSSIWFYLLFAFIGGLILNIMPCVLPVISIKLFGMIKHSDQTKGEIFRHNMFYSLGILLSFLVLAGSVHLLKTTGEEVGWGFQLQSPTFVAIMVLALFIFAINLFGLFEFSTPGGSKLGGVQLKDGYTGDILSGVLATILSTPCSAPFLGTALTFAFTTSTITLYLIFLMIGLGLAFPFILTGFFPKALAILPRPGMWMEHLKKFLGLSLILTMVWLLDVFVALSSTDALFALNVLLAMIFFTLFFWHKVSKKIFYRLIFIILTCLTLIWSYQEISISESEVTTSGTTKIMHELAWEKWTPEKMNNPGQLTFVDFTAKWCFTCKANERIVINTDAFRALVKKYNIKLLLADWTKRDAIIGNWLKEHGYAGVPVYFVVSADGKLTSLGETISIGKIEAALK